MHLQAGWIQLLFTLFVIECPLWCYNWKWFSVLGFHKRFIIYKRFREACILLDLRFFYNVFQCSLRWESLDFASQQLNHWASSSFWSAYVFPFPSTVSASLSVTLHALLIRFQKVLFSMTQLPSDPNLILWWVKLTIPPNYSQLEFRRQIYVKMRVTESSRSHPVFPLFAESTFSYKQTKAQTKCYRNSEGIYGKRFSQNSLKLWC